MRLIRHNKFGKFATGILVVMLILTMVFPSELAGLIGKDLFAQAGMNIGGSGTLVPGSPQTSISGIESAAFRIPPIRVSLFRNKKVLLKEENGLTDIYTTMNKGFPQDIQASLHFMNQNAINTIGSRPISIGKANTASKTLSYMADANQINNIIALGGSKPSGGVYYSQIKSEGIDTFKTNWRSKATNVNYSKGAWSYILESDGGVYRVDSRINEIFNPSNMDYNHMKSWTQAQSDDVYMHYVDMLVTLYTVASGATKQTWGQAVDDLLNSENLQESPISVCIDSEALMTFNYSAYFILLPTIDYFEFTTGMETNYAIAGDPWWAGTNKDKYPGNSYAQLKYATQLSLNASPDFDRITDYYNKNNGFSFSATAWSTGVLQTGTGTANWTASDHTLTDYINIFTLTDPAGNKGERGFMLMPAPLKGPGFSYGALKAQPDNKVIETKTVGMPVGLTVSSGVSSKDYGTWETLIKNAETQGLNFDVSMTFSRTSADTSDPINMAENPIKLTWSPDEMLEFIYGRKNFATMDNTSGISTEGKEWIRLDYKVDLDIKCGDKDFKGVGADKASFRILPPRMGYTSKPDAYSELKNYGKGSTQTGTLKEDYEAMAGVPSTEQLYFAAGGSEFIVDVTVERIEDEVAKRSYDSYYTAVPSEFKDGDTAKTKTFPAPGGTGVSGNTTWDPHAGGSFTITWTGTIPNKAVQKTSSGSGSVTDTSTAIPDRTAYDAAKAAAQAYVTAVNGTTFSWTAASDGKVRSKNAWGAAITTDSSPNPQNTSDTQTKYHWVSTPPSGGYNAPDPVTASATPSGATNYSISVTWSIAAHIICGPDCSSTLPEIHDTWAQTWTYDTMKIVDVHLWKLDQAAVNGLVDIISTDVVGADIVKGDPNIFYNIALKNDPGFVAQNGKGGASGSSKAGRVRYSLDPMQHDEVIYNNGPRTNKSDGLATTYAPNVTPNGGGGHAQSYATGITYNSFVPGTSTSGATSNAGQLNYPTNTDGYLQAHTDAKDKATVEYAKFLSQRTAKVTPTVITDFLILQTTAGDQSVLYFHKSNPTPVNAESLLPQMNIETKEMWDDNPNSAAKWKEDRINVGSYNGKYSTPASKFTWTNAGNVPTTFFDSDPAGTIIRPTRPNGNMMLYKGALNIIEQNKNKSYATGKAEVFWTNYLHWTDTSSIRFKDITDPIQSAPFPTDMGIGPITNYNFAATTQVDVGTFDLNNRMNLRPGTTRVGGSAVTDAANEGWYGPYIDATIGRYQVDVYGTGLANGNAVIYTDYGATNWTDKVKYTSRTDTHVTYTVDIPANTNILELCWHSSNSSAMKIDSEKVVRISNTNTAAGGYIVQAPYSDAHLKINDLIVQDPVSTQNVSLVSLPSSRDQRTGTTLGGAADVKSGINDSQVCPRDPALCDFRVLNCTYFKDTVIADFDFNTTDSGGNPVNKATGNSLILPTGFTLSGGSLSAKGTRVALPFSELQLSYQSSTRVKVEGDVTMSAPVGNGTMLWSFQSYDLYIPTGQQYATLNTGNGWERKLNVPIADGVKHHIAVTYSFNSVDRCSVTIDGVEPSYTRINASNDVTSQNVGSNLYIGCWGINNSYPANYTVDNFKVTRLAGSATHNEDCYKLVTVHPNGLNAHQHSAACLDGTGTTGAQWFIDGITNGTITDTQARDMLGAAYDPVMANSFGPIIHTWNGWSPTNMQGFSALQQATLSTSGGTLIQTSSGVDPIMAVPVNISASGVTKVDVTLDNKTSSTLAQMFWARNDSPSYLGSVVATATMLANTDNQVVSFVVRNNAEWKNTITSLRFDLGNTAGTVNVKNINVYGGGTRTSSGSSGAGTVVWENGTAGTYNYAAPAGTYKLEVWGAQGGQNGNAGVGGNGGYSYGEYNLTSASNLAVVVGGVGSGSAGTTYWTRQGTGGYNGGGAPGYDTDGNDNGYNEMGGGGGGYTTIRNGSALVTAGGGGGRTYTNTAGGRGTGGSGGGSYYNPGAAGTLADSGGVAIGGVVSRSSVDYEATGWANTPSVVNATAIAANATMPNPAGGTIVGKTGDGYARITSSFSPVVITGGGSSSGVTQGQVFSYGATGGVQSVTLPVGTYKFEVWGAQAGTGTYVQAGTGGAGGYSVGTKDITSEQTVYVYTGGQGRNAIEANSGAYVVDNPGGWNGGGMGGHMAGSGGGASDIRMGGTTEANRVIVAGGGGGGGQQSSGGPATKQGGRYDTNGNGGSGADATYTSTGTGGNAINVDNGGGGGGYLGGIGSQGGVGADWGGDGGSNYAGGVTSSNGITAQTIAGNATMPNPAGGTMVGKTGDGYVRITAVYVKPVVLISINDIKAYFNLIPDKLANGTNNPIWGCDRKPNIHVHDSACTEVKVLVCTEPHHQGMHYDVSNKICWAACNNDENHKNYKPTINAADGTFTPGNFVNMDYGFRMYYPNRGDFNQGQPYGIGGLTSQRGLGYVDNMDTTKWTRVKQIKFEYNVIYKGVLYTAGQWILLGDRGTYNGAPGSVYNESNWSNYGTEIYNDISKDYYDFYCVLANYEAKSAAIDVQTTGINCPGPNDNIYQPTNKVRGLFTSLHGGSNRTYADVVGRIGNLIIEDTGDYRFSNFFKSPLENNTTPTPTIYGTTNGLTATGTATSSAGKINISQSGSGAAVSNVSITQGFFRIDVIGKALNNGRLKVQTVAANGNASEDWSGDTYIKNVTVTTTKMSFYLTAPSDSKLDISWVANNSASMEVENISLTKLGKSAETWVIDGVVRDVDEADQNYYMTWSSDIRGLPITTQTNYVNTYSTLNWMDANRVQAPVSAEKNNIEILKDEPLLVGYPLYFDISTLGNYWLNNSSEIQVVPYYYALNLTTKQLLPVDAYFKYANQYQPVNIHNLVTPTWDGKGVYNYVITLDWLGESARRNYTNIEKMQTDFFRDFYAEGTVVATLPGDSGAGDTSLDQPKTPKQLDAPGGNNYVLGNAQMLSASGKARTFIGGETTYGQLMNLGGANNISTDDKGRKFNAEGKIPDYQWWQSAQRWHLKLGVPSSTIFIRNGLTPDATNIKEFDNANYVILATADIRVIGNTYVLRYQHTNDNGSINVQRSDGTWSGAMALPNNIPPVLAVYSTTKSSMYDVDIIGDH